MHLNKCLERITGDASLSSLQNVSQGDVRL